MIPNLLASFLQQLWKLNVLMPALSERKVDQLMLALWLYSAVLVTTLSVVGRLDCQCATIVFTLQVYSSDKPCTGCGCDMTSSKRTAHWEGGKGCRSKTKMDRYDIIGACIYSYFTILCDGLYCIGVCIYVCYT